MNIDESGSQQSNSSSSTGSAESTGTDSPAAATGTALGQDGKTVNEFVNRVADSLHETVDQAAAAAAPHVEHLQASIEELDAQAREQAEEVLGRLEHCTASLRTSVRAHPLAALGAAFFAGLLIARLAR